MSYLPLLEVSCDLVAWPRSVLTHLDLDSDHDQPQPGPGPMISKMSRNGSIVAIAKVCDLQYL